MRQVFIEKGSIVVKDSCKPLCDVFSVLVSVHYSFISTGTEVATIAQSKQSTFFSNVPHKIKKVLESVAKNGVDGTKALIKGKLKGTVQSLGYSCSGKVIAVGKKVKTLRIGDCVACAGAGLANHADIVAVPENLVVRLSNEKQLKKASLTTIGSIALQGIRRANLQLGETVCVIGLGLLGQIVVQLAKLSGCRVIGVDVIPERMEQAKRLGAFATFNALHDDVKKEIEFLTEHYGADSTIITAASKSDSIVQQAMEVTRKKGRVVLVGDVGLNIERSPFYKKEIDFLISCSYGPGRYDSAYEQEGKDYPYAYVRWTENRNMQAFVQLIENGQIDIDSLIADEVPLTSIEKAYDSLKNPQNLGIVLSYLPKDVSQEKSVNTNLKNNVSYKPTQKIRVGFVGAGGFAKIKLMPLVSQIKNVTINAIVDVDVSSSINSSKLYGAAHVLVDDKQLFAKDCVDAVVIATPHTFHCQQIITAMQQGKAVFCEKPMVTDFNQLQQLTECVQKRKDVPFCVDYNRSFAPYIQKIKKHTEKRATPLVVHYRMNAGYISGDHWVQKDVGAGRIIGEACHIFDLFCFLTDARPVAVSVEAVHARQKDIFNNDNFSAQISFEDGSICTLLYTALGNSSLGKERMELFFDGKSIVMNDYKELVGFGIPGSFNEKTKNPDKGHKELISQFFESLKKERKEAPINFDRMRTVAEISLIVNQLASKGGGKKELH